VTSPLGSGPILSVGATSADLMHMGRDVAALEQAGVKALHFDVMDGRFVPQLTVGPSFVKGFRTALFKDVHLMIEDPLASLPAYVAAGADAITIHPEACRHPHQALKAVRQLGEASGRPRPLVRGIALNPSSPLALLEPLLDEVDLVLLVAVNPGFSGQSFVERTADRYRQVRGLVRPLGRNILVGVDGGVTRHTIGRIAELEPDWVVSGSAVFEEGRIADNVAFLQGALTRAAS
jgi:ribulose-phosphate 3-epimerase